MAIITFSRQAAALGDELSQLVAKKMNYTFVGREDLEKKIVALGFPKEKLHKYDEKSPGFFASLAKDRDEYLDYLQTAVLEVADENNCVIVGRGSSVILNSVQNHFCFRVLASKNDRIQRLNELLQLDEKRAEKKLAAADKQKSGFYKSFFNCQVDDPTLYHAVINTSAVDLDAAAEMIVTLVKASITQKKEELGRLRLDEMLVCQRIVNMLILEYCLNINFLHATARDGKVILHGVADSTAIVERALTITQAELPEYKVESAINVVQDFKAYPQ
ncbi:MAG: cytidylate kinase-like family protein [Treponema berlinense]|uniref:cytidylate kinase-like family protein n=1 Tax=Treponema TaxID=157 RepID=UPI002356020F|nr:MULTISPECIES: cytidylate kinase-like family protein [Treponema]MBQ9102004.1 cytidylate kinase-like family protein [Treponema sp.]MDD5834486.1 cytidylate kinase-like family protein [Treponema berlinense]